MKIQTCVVVGVALLAALLASACGGGVGADSPDDRLMASTRPGREHATTPNPDRQRQTLAASGGYSVDTATRIFELAESNYAAYFPGQQTSRAFEGWAYRYYPQTSVYLAVIGSDVVVLGGPFGPEFVRVGAVAD